MHAAQTPADERDCARETGERRRQRGDDDAVPEDRQRAQHRGGRESSDHPAAAVRRRPLRTREHGRRCRRDDGSAAELEPLHTAGGRIADRECGDRKQRCGRRSQRVRAPGRRAPAGVGRRLQRSQRRRRPHPRSQARTSGRAARTNVPVITAGRPSTVTGTDQRPTAPMAPPGGGASRWSCHEKERPSATRCQPVPAATIRSAVAVDDARFASTVPSAKRIIGSSR